MSTYYFPGYFCFIFIYIFAIIKGYVLLALNKSLDNQNKHGYTTVEMSRQSHINSMQVPLKLRPIFQLDTLFDVSFFLHFLS